MKCILPLMMSVLLLCFNTSCQQSAPKEITDALMEDVFEQVKTPFKYGIVLTAPDSTKMADSPTVFRLNNKWYMTYIVFDGRGYETWIAASDDLLNWTPKGKTMSFTDSTWDASQKAGYVALVDTRWGGSYEPMKHEDKYWISYLGGSVAGYEAGRLGVGIAYTEQLNQATEWMRLPDPVMTPDDADRKWFDNKTIFKSSVIYDAEKLTGYPFVMYYNAAGDSSNNGHQFESIAMAGSHDMKKWTRLSEAPILTKGRGICGDAQIVKMDDLYVMFFFGHNWKESDGAFDRFACSYDLKNWKEWNGPNLVEPTEPFDKKYAHKPWMIQWNGVVYHFYNAVGEHGRVIALATSKDLKEQ